MSSTSIKWIKSGIIIATLIFIPIEGVLADVFQTSQNWSEKPVSNPGNSSGADFIAFESSQSLLDKDEMEIALKENQQFEIYFPFVMADYCKVFLFDDFSDPTSGWPIVNEEDRLLEYTSGEYRILTKNENMWAVASPGIQVEDYIVSVKVRNENGVEGFYGIIFQLAEDWSTYYTFEIDTITRYVIWHYDSHGNWHRLKWDYSEYLNGLTASNEIQLIRNGEQVKFYANGHLIHKLDNKKITRLGSVGLITTANDNANVDARFDNFTVSSLGCTE
jgi:hypothetical protein